MVFFFFPFFSLFFFFSLPLCVHVHSLLSTLSEGSAAAFVTGVVPSPVQVGVPFPLPLQFTDEFNHPTLPPSGIKPQLECR